MSKPKLYLAGPLFTAAERKFNKSLAWALRDWDYDIWLPQEKEPRELTARAIYEMDIQGVEWCDVVVACMDGPDPDSGTAFECGYARRAGKKILCYRTDFRACGDMGNARYNLMLWSGADRRIQTPMGMEMSEIAAMIRVGLRDLGFVPPLLIEEAENIPMGTVRTSEAWYGPKL
jgi:nucleoside 2-deoxyribosyltransferase